MSMSTIENIELGSDTKSSLLNKMNPLALMPGRDFQEVYFDSPYGKIQVIIQGTKGETPIVTFHDLGLNGRMQYTGFFASQEMEKIMEHFCAYHITAPGQDENAAVIPQDAKYPTMDEMADIVDYAIGYFKLGRVIGLGIGLGAHVIAKTALFYPERFVAIVTINCVSTVCGWSEWASTMLMKFHLRHGTIDANVVNNLLHHNVGYEAIQRKPDLSTLYAEYFESILHPYNFQRLLDSYSNRTAIEVARDSPDTEHFKCPVMNVVGDYSPHVDDAVEFNGKLDPKTSTFVKLSDCGGMILEEQPDKFAETFMYFLQGLGYVSNLSMTRSLSSRLHDRIVSERVATGRARSKTTIIQPSQTLIDTSTIPKEV